MEVIEYCKMTAERGGHYCTAHPIDHMTRLQCREDVLKQILADNELKKRFTPSVKRLNRWWWSVCFIENVDWIKMM